MHTATGPAPEPYDYRGVTLQARYAAASAEINARIQARQVVTVFYVGGSATLLGLIFNDGTQRSVAGSPNETVILGLLPAIFSFAFACWIRHHDLIIGMLSTFCRICEAADARSGVPSWHCNRQGWQEAAVRNRRWLDLGFLIVCLATVGITSVRATRGAGTLRSQVLFLAFMIAGLTLWTIVGLHYRRAALLYHARFEENHFRYVEPKRTSYWAVGLFMSSILYGLLCFLPIEAAFADPGFRARLPYQVSVAVAGLVAGFAVLPVCRNYDLHLFTKTLLPRRLS
jgi:hypothetical protein